MHIKYGIEALEDWKIGYIAGIIDGEGCIGLYKDKTYHCLVRVTSTNHVFTTMLRDITDLGTLSGTDRKEPNHKRQETWLVQNRAECLMLLRKVSPMLFLKYKQAALAIEFCEKSLTRTITDCRCAEIKEELHKLNKVGTK